MNVQEFQTISAILLKKHYGICLDDTRISDVKFVIQCISQGWQPFEVIAEHAEDTDLVRIDVDGFYGVPSMMAITIEDQEAALTCEVPDKLIGKKEGQMSQTDYQITSREAGIYEVRLLVDGSPCPGRLGLLSGRPGHWEAEWVDGSRVGSFKTLKDGAAALGNYRYRI